MNQDFGHHSTAIFKTRERCLYRQSARQAARCLFWVLELSMCNQWAILRWLFLFDLFQGLYFQPLLFDFNYNSINNDFGHRNNQLQLGPNILGSQVKGSSQARLFNASGLLTISVEQWLIFISHAVVYFSSPLSFSRMKLLTNQLN